jgi:hypothetical protein
VYYIHGYEIDARARLKELKRAIDEKLGNKDYANPKCQQSESGLG